MCRDEDEAGILTRKTLTSPIFGVRPPRGEGLVLPVPIHSGNLGVNKLVIRGMSINDLGVGVAVMNPIRRAVFEQRLFVGLTLAYILGFALLALVLGRPFPWPAPLRFYGPPVVALAAIVVIYRVWVVMVGKPTDRRQAVRAVLRDLAESQWVANALPSLLLMPPFFAVYSTTVGLIPIPDGYNWDVTFALWDRAMHGGDPWRLLQPVLGSPAITLALDLTYNAWFAVLLCVWFAVALQKDPVLRSQFLLSVLALWIIGGSLLGPLFASAGPEYFGRMYPDFDNPYSPLAGYLRHAAKVVPISAPEVQDGIWSFFPGGVRIGAMPSLHVAGATLFALTIWQLDRRFGAALWVFAGMVFLATIHLGWHYAIDGEAGALLAWAIWWAVGRLVSRDTNRRVASTPKTAIETSQGCQEAQQNAILPSRSFGLD